MQVKTTTRVDRLLPRVCYRCSKFAAPTALL